MKKIQNVMENIVPNYRYIVEHTDF